MATLPIEVIAWGDMSRANYATIRKTDRLKQFISPGKVVDNVQQPPELTNTPGYWPLTAMPAWAAAGSKWLSVEIDESLIGNQALQVSIVNAAGDPVPPGTNVYPPTPAYFYPPVASIGRGN